MEGRGDGPASSRRFFKVFFPDLHSHHLEIPRPFLKHAKDLTLGRVSLVGMSGNTWEVELAEVGGKLCFHTCWGDFVRDHELQAGDFLVFAYDGACRFSVLVLDHSGCEKESAFHACPLREPSAVVAEEEVSGGESPVCLVQRSFEVITKTVGPEEPGKKRRGRKPHGCPLGEELWAGGVKKPIRGKRILLSQRRPVGREEIDRAQANAFSFRSRNPYFTVVMKKSAVYTGYMLNIPQVFARAHLPKEGGRMKLVDPKGQLWHITYICKYGYFFSGGWRRFSIGNHLEEHDVCVFELVEPRIIHVHIFRVVEELAPMILKSLKYVEAKQPMTHLPNGKIIRCEN